MLANLGGAAEAFVAGGKGQKGRCIQKPRAKRRREPWSCRRESRPRSRKGGPRFPGEIELAFSYPAPVSSWCEGGSYTVILRHPAGTIVVQGSAGFVPGALKDVKADVVFLGIGGLIRIGEPHFRNYWREVVRATGAPHVVPVHYDDLTRPADAPAIGFFPRMIDDAPTVIGWMQEQTDADVSLIPWREPIVLLSAKP